MYSYSSFSYKSRNMKFAVFAIAALAFVVFAPTFGANHDLYIGTWIDYGTYIVDYNFTVGQANYVLYRPGVGRIQSNETCWNRLADGYNYTWRDYIGLQISQGIDRGYLATRASQGVLACNMNNIVPMNSSFNQQIWQFTRTYLQARYPKHWVAVGCRYKDDRIIHNSRGKKLYLTDGCYYAVFSDDFEFQGKIEKQTHVNLVTHRYYSAFGEVNEKLPWWLVQEKSSTPKLEMSVVILMIWAVGVSIMVIFAMVIMVIPYPSREYVPNPV